MFAAVGYKHRIWAMDKDINETIKMARETICAESMKKGSKIYAGHELSGTRIVEADPEFAAAYLAGKVKNGRLILTFNSP
jgi:hypothetical protein